MPTHVYPCLWADLQVCPTVPLPRLIGMQPGPWDFEPNLPKSVQIADEIERRIRSGKYRPKAPIYEVRIAQEFDVARETARKAVSILRVRGLVETVRGMGSFVLALPQDEP